MCCIAADCVEGKRKSNMSATLIFPHQLFFPSRALSKSRKVYLIEDPLFFSDFKYKVKFHKQKILLHYLSMNSFKKELETKGYFVELIKYETLENSDYFNLFFKQKDIKEIHFLDVHDYELNRRILSASKKNNIKINRYDTPGFLLGLENVKADFSTKQSFKMGIFYKKQRRRFNILMNSDGSPKGDQWNFDMENRKRLPKDIDLPPIEKIFDKKHIPKKFEKNISLLFNDHFGCTKKFIYPTTRSEAKKGLINFLSSRFNNFGPYEDAIAKNETIIFHSLLSPSLNIGLITPKEIIETTQDFVDEYDIPINSYEGFIRQIIGWREFIRGIYQAKGSFQRNSNFWQFKNKLPKTFWNGNTGIDPIDDSIKKITNYAYCHHIERLMILGNFMLLLKTNPNNVYNWFMEMFIDAYDWVMVPNIYGMSQFADGGVMTTKPYISGSNYILKMSDYRKDSWCELWDAYYWRFINEQRSFFRKNPRMSMMVSLYDKKPLLQKQHYEKIINDYIEY